MGTGGKGSLLPCTSPVSHSLPPPNPSHFPSKLEWLGEGRGAAMLKIAAAVPVLSLLEGSVEPKIGGEESGGACLQGEGSE